MYWPQIVLDGELPSKNRPRRGARAEDGAAGSLARWFARLLAGSLSVSGLQNAGWTGLGSMSHEGTRPKVTCCDPLAPVKRNVCFDRVGCQHGFTTLDFSHQAEAEGHREWTGQGETAKDSFPILVEKRKNDQPRVPSPWTCSADFSAPTCGRSAATAATAPASGTQERGRGTRHHEEARARWEGRGDVLLC